jgi:protease-4
MAAGRGIDPAVIQRLADEYPVEVLPEAAYPNLQFALDQDVIDGTMTFPEYRAWMMNRFGVDKEADTETYPYITAAAYLAQLEEEESGAEQSVAVVFVEGLLSRGEQRPGIAGADDIAHLLRRAYEDEDTRAIVLRVNSPGGTVLASDMVREELLSARGRGLPVVVSMGDAATSGGMWVSAPADRIFAMPTTITGSIGVALVIPSAGKFFAAGGITFDGMGTSEHAGWDIHQPVDEKLDAAFKRHTAAVYQRFIEIVAEGRGREPEEIRSIAGGRVWLGDKALDVGLVDELGDLEDAVVAAAAMAELEDYRVDYVTVDVPFGTRLLRDLMAQVPLAANPVMSEVNGLVGQWLARFAGVSEPRVEVLCGACLVPID